MIYDDENRIDVWSIRVCDFGWTDYCRFCFRTEEDAGRFGERFLLAEKPVRAGRYTPKAAAEAFRRSYEYFEGWGDGNCFTAEEKERAFAGLDNLTEYVVFSRTPGKWDDTEQGRFFSSTEPTEEEVRKFLADRSPCDRFDRKELWWIRADELEDADGEEES